jgi:hypothetical protein
LPEKLECKFPEKFNQIFLLKTTATKMNFWQKKGLQAFSPSPPLSLFPV